MVPAIADREWQGGKSLEGQQWTYGNNSNPWPDSGGGFLEGEQDRHRHHHSPPPYPQPPQPPSDNGYQYAAIIIVATGAVALAVIIYFCCIRSPKNDKTAPPPMPPPRQPQAPPLPPRRPLPSRPRPLYSQPAPSPSYHGSAGGARFGAAVRDCRPGPAASPRSVHGYGLGMRETRAENMYEDLYRCGWPSNQFYWSEDDVRLAGGVHSKMQPSQHQVNLHRFNRKFNLSSDLSASSSV